MHEAVNRTAHIVRSYGRWIDNVVRWHLSVRRWGSNEILIISCGISDLQQWWPFSIMKSKRAIRAIQYCSFSSERSSRRQRAIPLATPSFQSDTKLGPTWPAFRLYTRSRIEDIFAHYAPRVDPRPFVSASVVFPMRVNNYVLDNLIDWLVSSITHPFSWNLYIWWPTSLR
jgi:hypothetical protein